MIKNFKDYTSHIDDSRCNVIEFKKLACEFSFILKKLNVNISPFRPNRSKLVFEERNLAHQKKAIAYLDLSIEIFKESVLLGETGRESGKLLWRFCKRLGQAPQDDIFDKISDDDLVEVYCTDHTPIFRNLKFYEEFSYTVDEALCLPWYQACRRDLITTIKMMKFTLMYLRRPYKDTQKWPVPLHLVDELNTEKEYRFWTQMKYISGIHSKGVLTGVISICGVGVIGEKKMLWAENAINSAQDKGL
ncbi:MAG: hypothetical protein K2Q18_18880 [Bdellovibrionales bacterium]|nr:hypothetical protein [Bdellovibrionales bacterium]